MYNSTGIKFIDIDNEHLVFSLIVALNHDKIKIKITFIPQCLTNKHGSKICIITYTCPSVTSFKFSIFTAIIDLKGVFWIWGFLVEKNKHQLKYQLKKESPEHQHSETLLHIQWKQGNNQQYGSPCKFSLCPPLFCCIVVELNWCHATWIVHVSFGFCPPPFLLCRGSTVDVIRSICHCCYYWSPQSHRRHGDEWPLWVSLDEGGPHVELWRIYFHCSRSVAGQWWSRQQVLYSHAIQWTHEAAVHK